MFGYLQRQGNESRMEPFILMDLPYDSLTKLTFRSLVFPPEGCYTFEIELFMKCNK